jgi:hypothetical protein
MRGRDRHDNGDKLRGCGRYIHVTASLKKTQNCLSEKSWHWTPSKQKINNIL